MKKLGALLLGVLFSFLLVEGAIRLFGLIYQNLRQEAPLTDARGGFRILCLGNSHTAGAGVPIEDAYPDVLNRKLDQIYGQNKIKVINQGIGNANTAIILDRLPELLKDIRPNLVLIMTGEPNFWYPYGFSRFSKTESWWEKTLGVLDNSRFIRFFEIFLNRQGSSYEELAPDEKALYWVENINEFLFHPSTSSQDLSESEKALESYLSRNQGKGDILIREVCSILARIKAEYGGDFSEAFRVLEISIRASDEFDVLAYNFLSADKYFVAASADEIRKRQELLSLAKKGFPGDKVYSEYLKYEVSGVASLEELKKYLKLRPGNAKIYQTLIEKLVSSKSFDDHEIVDLSISGLEVALYFRQGRFFRKQLQEVSKRTTEDGLKDRINRFLEEYAVRFPSAKFFGSLADQPKIFEWIKSADQAQIFEWIKSDLRQIIEIVQHKKIPLVIQNYHLLRGAAFLDQSRLNDVLKEVANERGVLYSDTYSYFSDAIKKSGLPEQDFYLKNDEHPSKLGHQIIAEKLVEEIVNNQLYDPVRFKEFEAIRPQDSGAYGDVEPKITPGAFICKVVWGDMTDELTKTCDKAKHFAVSEVATHDSGGKEVIRGTVCCITK